MKIYLILLFLFSCSSSKEQDPLIYSKKHMAQHASLYKNGAFEVPMTNVKLIPPGPETVELISMAVGIKARDSFLLALKNAASTVNIVKAGTIKSMQLADGVYQETQHISADVAQKTWHDSTYIISKSAILPKDASVYSFELTKKVIKELWDLGRRLDHMAEKQGEEVRDYFLQNSYLYADSLAVSSKEFSINSKNAGTQLQKDLSKSGKKLDAEISNGAKENAKIMLNNSKEMRLSSWNAAKQLNQEMSELGTKTDDALSQTGTQIRKQSAITGQQVEHYLNTQANISVAETEKLAKFHRRWAKKQFIQGYLAMPARIGQRSQTSKDRTLESAGKLFEKINETRHEGSTYTSTIFWQTAKEYGNDSMESLQNARKEIVENSSKIGITLGMIKAILWASKAIFLDAIIIPVSKFTFAGLGYITINSAAYPTMLVGAFGFTTAQIAVEATWNATAMAYDLVAPSFISSVASVFSLLEITSGRIAGTGLKVMAKSTTLAIQGQGLASDAALTATGKIANVAINSTGKIAASSVAAGGQILAGATVAAAPVVYAGGAVAGKTARAGSEIVGASGNALAHIGATTVSTSGQMAGEAVTSSGWVAGQLLNLSYNAAGKIQRGAIDLIGVPLAAVGITTAGAGVGLAVGGAGIVAGTTYLAVGETAAASSYAFGTTLSGATRVVGPTLSLAAASTVAAYELAKMITVPSSYTLGSGLVLGYGSLVQLSAQLLLGASDMAYMVLSLEGPRWVIYAVQGKLNNGAELVPGTILDLERMKQQGEVIKYVPASEEDIRRLLDAPK